MDILCLDLQSAKGLFHSSMSHKFKSLSQRKMSDVDFWLGGRNYVAIPYGGTVTVTTRTFYDESQVPSYVLRQLDLTQKKLSCAEKDNEQLAEELEQVKKELAKTQEELRKKNIELETFLSSAANKLATPPPKSYECKHD